MNAPVLPVPPLSGLPVRLVAIQPGIQPTLGIQPTSEYPKNDHHVVYMDTMRKNNQQDDVGASQNVGP
jgi:hypothetical protein